MLGNAIKGSLRPSQSITWLRDTNIPEDLTGATITGKIYSLATKETRDIEGSLTVSSGPAGVFIWDYASGDVISAGQFKVQFTAVFVGSPTPAKTRIDDWHVFDSL